MLNGPAETNFSHPSMSMSLRVRVEAGVGSGISGLITGLGVGSECGVRGVIKFSIDFFSR
jgi:hypothetical protein